MQRVVFLDVDGTLVGHDGLVPTSAASAVVEARANGHLVLLCTGRSRPELWPAVTDLGFDGLVAGAGAYVEVGGVELAHHHLDDAQVAHVVDYFGRLGFDFFFEGAYGLFGTPALPERLHRLLLEAVPDAAARATLESGFFAYIDKIAPLPGVLTTPVSKVLFLREPTASFDDVRAEFSNFAVIPSSVPSFGAECGEMQLPGIHKASGIDLVIEHLGLDRAQTIAIGDSDNDLEMLAHAGVGIAMGNARPHVKEAADEITGTVEEGGVRQAFVKHGLIAGL